ncbi:MAG: hypothetical protein AB2L14_28775 [Candidatus Xenobiia bacterium LiM19]
MEMDRTLMRVVVEVEAEVEAEVEEAEDLEAAVMDRREHVSVPIAAQKYPMIEVSPACRFNARSAAQ